MMWKFGLILLIDIIDDRKSVVRCEFTDYMLYGG